MEQIFFEIHSDNPREGPGSRESTHKAYGLLSDVHSKPDILDIGCGPGVQTLDLAKISDGRITAIDNYQPYIERLIDNIKNRNLDSRISPLITDMSNLNFEQNTFDIIWSEGAIYIIGFEEGLNVFSRFLKPGGYIAVTELSWFRSDAPAELVEFWQEEYPAIQTIENNLQTIEKCGLKPVGNFNLPDSDWWDDYYNSILKRIEYLKPKYASNPEAEECFAMELKEMEMHRKFSKFYGYVFYVMRKPKL